MSATRVDSPAGEAPARRWGLRPAPAPAGRPFLPAGRQPAAVRAEGERPTVARKPVAFDDAGVGARERPEGQAPVLLGGDDTPVAGSGGRRSPGRTRSRCGAARGASPRAAPRAPTPATTACSGPGSRAGVRSGPGGQLAAPAGRRTAQARLGPPSPKDHSRRRRPRRKRGRRCPRRTPRTHPPRARRAASPALSRRTGGGTPRCPWPPPIPSRPARRRGPRCRRAPRRTGRRAAPPRRPAAATT